MSSSSSSSSQRPPESHFPCHYDDRSSSCVPPPADWVNHNQPPSSSVMTRSRTGGESHFDFFYHAIFTFVHSALTILLAPVLKNTTRRPRRSSSPSRTQRATAMPPQSLHREVDPELAMPPQMNYDRSSSNNNSSILKSHQRRDSYQQQQQAAQSAAAAKSVRFPEPKRSRPPLGRISSSIGSTTTTTTASSSTSASVSSSESSRSSSSLSSSSSSSDGSRGRISPWRVSPSPRTHHSTYFLSD